MRIVIQPHKEEGEAIKAAAERAGVKTQRYILEAIRTRMESEKWQWGVQNWPTHFVLELELS